MGNVQGWRVELLTRLPWLDRLDEPGKCVEYRWSSMSMKAAHNLELRERYRCKRLAYWQFTGLKPHKKDHVGLEVGKSGVYCYSHLINQAFLPDRERARYEKWCQANLELIERIKSGAEPRLITRRRNHAAHDLSDEA